VAALGGKYFYDDDQQFPDTQYVVYEYASEARGVENGSSSTNSGSGRRMSRKATKNGNAFLRHPRA